MFTVIGLDNYDSGMRSVNLLEGNKPSQQNTLPQVMMDEGSLLFLEWDVNDIQTVEINGISQDVEIVGSTRGDFVRTMYFLRGDLSEIIGINATSVYLDLPRLELNELGEISVGIVERQSLIDGIESLIEQQTQISKQSSWPIVHHCSHAQYYDHECSRARL